MNRAQLAKTAAVGAYAVLCPAALAIHFDQRLCDVNTKRLDEHQLLQRQLDLNTTKTNAGMEVINNQLMEHETRLTAVSQQQKADKQRYRIVHGAIKVALFGLLCMSTITASAVGLLKFT